MTASYRVAVIPGDYIGPEVTSAAQLVLEDVAAGFGFEFRWDMIMAGGSGYEAYGTPIRAQDLATAAAADAVLLGAVGGPQWDELPAALRPEQAIFQLRRSLELFANLRPVAVEPALIDSSPLRPERLAGADMMIVRELTGGLYFGPKEEEHVTADGSRAALDTLPYSEAEITRIVRLAFELARGRRHKVTSVDKANALATSRFWRHIADEVGREFPDVRLEHRLVDACAMQLITNPADFDVLVTDNLFGDILSDEASVLAGSLGLLPSASLGARRTAHGIFGLYEPIHGTAPDIAGRDLANPSAAILSGAMMLRWSFGQTEAAALIESTIRRTLTDGIRTGDLIPKGSESAFTRVGTKDFLAAVRERLAAPA